MHVAVAHYPEGNGHATRCLAVANALRERGATVDLAGGGPGARFAGLHGYEEFRPAPVDYIGDYQEGSLREVFTGSLPASAARVRDYLGWLRERDPAAMVTDDMFGAAAAAVAGVDLYVLTHNAPVLYADAVERGATWALTRLQVRAAEAFLYLSLWPPVAGDPAGVDRVGPVALAGEDEPAVADPGVLVVPSHYSPDPGGLADRIRGTGRTATLVGGPDWESVPSLLPTARAAEAVVCSGYSTVMEAAVAGTPCVLVPRTDEQRGVARLLARNRVPGVRVASPADLPAALEWADGADPPARENGAAAVADRVVDGVDARLDPSPE
jgi:hypothetical protein